MPGTKKQPVALHTTLLEGLTVKSRADGSVITVKGADGKVTVAEVCVGASKVRLNVRAKAQVPKGVTLSGKSKSWPEGGVVVTEANLAAVRALLAALTSAPAPAAPAPVPATPKRKTSGARKPRSRRAAAAA